jgi:hypothetical protein
VAAAFCATGSFLSLKWGRKLRKNCGVVPVNDILVFVDFSFVTIQRHCFIVCVYPLNVSVWLWGCSHPYQPKLLHEISMRLWG